MKMFTLWFFGMSASAQEIWREEGFNVMQDWQPEFTERVTPDLIYLAEATAGLAEPLQQMQEQLRTSYPKLFFLHSSALSLMPQHWQAYTKQTVQVAGVDWIIGSKLEEPLPQAVSEYLALQKTAELAAVLYIVILESVFRETAEWCGHMSSVVGRM